MFARSTKIAQLLLSLYCIAGWSYVSSEDGLTQLNAESTAPEEITLDAKDQTSQSSRQLGSDDISISDQKANINDVLRRKNIKSDGDDSKRNYVRVARSEIFSAIDEEDEQLEKEIESSFYDDFDTLSREEVPVVPWRFSRMMTYDNVTNVLGYIMKLLAPIPSKSKRQSVKIYLTSFVDDPALSPSEVRDALAEEELPVVFRRKRSRNVIKNWAARILKELNDYGIMRFNKQKESPDPTTISSTASGTQSKSLNFFTISPIASSTHSQASDSSTVSPTISDTHSKSPIILDIWIKKVLKAFDEYGIKYFFEPPANDTQSRLKRESEEIDLNFIDDSASLSSDPKTRNALAKEKPSVTFRWKRSLGNTFDNWTASVLKAFDTYGIMYFFPPLKSLTEIPTANVAKSRSKRIRRVMNSHSDPSTVSQRSRPIRSLSDNYNKTVGSNSTSENVVDSPPKA